MSDLRYIGVSRDKKNWPDACAVVLASLPSGAVRNVPLDRFQTVRMIQLLAAALNRDEAER